MPKSDPSSGTSGRRRSDAKHRAILQAAAELVRKNGYHAVTIEQVAAAAGVGKQTIYRWWPSKPALYLEVYRFLVPPDALVADAAGITNKLAGLLDALFRFYRTTPAANILAGLIGDAQSDPAAADILREGLVSGRAEIVTSLLGDAVSRGELPAEFDVRSANTRLVALIWHRLLCGAGEFDAGFARDVIDQVLETEPSQPGDITIEDYRPGALGRVCELQSAYYAREWDFGLPFETKVAGEMAEFLARADWRRDLFKVAVLDDEIVGSITLDVSAHDDGTAHLRWFVVADAVRGKGLGKQLMAHVMDFAQARGIERIYLTTFEGLDPARALYEKAGFKLTASEPGETWGRKVVEQRFDWTA